MKYIKILVLFFVLAINCAYGQTFDIDLSATMIKSNGPWKKGCKVHLTKFVHDVEVKFDTSNTTTTDLFYLEDDKGNRVNINSKVDDCFEFEYKNAQDFWDASIITNVLYQIKKNGFQHELRIEMENDALQYINEIKSRGLELNDPFLYTYIYGLIAKIAPFQLIDGRPGNINIIIQENPTINACCLPNGTIIINTGLLATLHSEDELVAVLAHEIAHFILDHAVQNINAAIARQKRAEFWNGLLTGLTAVAEGYISYKTGYYIPGGATLAMAAISTSIASKVIDRLGMNYNYKQEEEADKYAYYILETLGYNRYALSTALTRIKMEYINDRNNAVYVNSYNHPALIKRIMRLGSPNLICDKNFEQIISFAVSSVAMMKYSDGRFRQCLTFVNQNIKNGVATADDYILKANCLLSTRNDEASNQEILLLIDQAKMLDYKNINIYKTEILVTLRVNDKAKAISLLNSYIELLNNYNTPNIIHDKTINYILLEKKWSKDMFVKLKGMQ